MLSHLFQYISNRNNFENPWLNTVVPFTPVKPDSEIQFLRKQLLLDTTQFNSDYYITAAVSVLLSNTTLAHELNIQEDIQPEIWKKIQTEQFTIYTPNWILTNSKEGPASVNRKVDYWPVDVNITVTKLNDRTARVKSGNVFEDVEAVFLVNKNLEIKWPSWTGLNGVLKTAADSAWNTEMPITLKVVPSNYPTSQILDRIKNSIEFLNVLEKADLLAYYAGANTSVEDKLSLLLWAMYQDTKTKIQSRI